MISFIRKYGSIVAILLACSPVFGQTSNTGGGSSGGGGAPNVSNATGVLPVVNGGTGTTQGGPLNFFTPYTSISTASASFSGTVFLTCQWEPQWTISTGLKISINAADATHNQDICLYSLPAAFGAGSAQTATLITDTGAAFWPSTGLQSFTFLQNSGCTAANTPSNLCTGSTTGTLPALPIIEPAGYYCAAVTSAAATAKFNESNTLTLTLLNTNSVISTLGECPATIASQTQSTAFTAAQINSLLGY